MRKRIACILSIALCVGCLEPDDFVGDAMMSFRLGTSYVVVENSYNFNQVDYVLIRVYDNATTAPPTDERVRDADGDLEIRVDGQHIKNIRGTDKLYILRGQNLDIHDLVQPCTEDRVDDVLVSRGTNVDDWLKMVVGEIAQSPKEE